jgi:hypothetical protein
MSQMLLPSASTGGMTGITGGTYKLVIWHLLMLLRHFSLVTVLVAIYAGETVVDAAEVAFRAGNVVMIRSWAYGEPLIMIKCSALPGDSGVARFAGRGETSLYVIGVGGILVIGLVAEVAHCRRTLVLPAHMTVTARSVYMGAG